MKFDIKTQPFLVFQTVQWGLIQGSFAHTWVQSQEVTPDQVQSYDSTTENNSMLYYNKFLISDTENTNLGYE